MADSKNIQLIPRLFAGDIWGRKPYLKRSGEEGALRMISASYLKNVNWRTRTEAHLHQKISHSFPIVSKRWRTAEIRGLRYQVKNWHFYNRIHDSNSSHGFSIITL